MTSSPLILTVAPNGAYKTHAQHPAVPMTPETLALTARACLDVGVAMLHMHVRKPDGAHSLEAEDYLAATAAVRKAVGQEMVIQITTEAAQVYAPPAQMAVVHAVKPEAVSVGMCAFGAQEHACAIAAAALGGHARIGFENNLLLRDGTIAPNNTALAQQVVEGARALNRPLATAHQVRAQFQNA